MPVYVSEIVKNTTIIDFPVGDDKVSLAYHPALITEETFAKLQEFERMDPDQDIFGLFADLNEMIVYLVKSWDIYKDPDTVFPLDAKELAKMPLFLRLQVIQEIMSDFRPEAPGGDQTPTPTLSN